MDKRQQQIFSERHRLSAIEGLRGYLALWVVICHVLWVSGVAQEGIPEALRVLRDGSYAVDIFVIVSGFVIFLLLDTQRATYQQFILRRFFRLFPLFIALFVVSIPLSRLSLWNVAHASQYLTPEYVQSLTGTMTSWWQNFSWHVPLHLVMLHGTVPAYLLPDAPGAFLVPAWSVSLEWQFYLVAPLAYRMAISSNRFVRLGLLGICALAFVEARLGPWVNYGAFLPFHVEYFVVGGASYFVYKYRSRLAPANAWFAVMCGASAAFLAFRGLSWTIPVGLWFVFFGVVLERPSSLSSRLTSPIFTNAVSQHLGKISYSIYLSHILVIALMQYLLLAWLPQLSLTGHILLLLSLTFTVTVAVSTALHRYVETPGIAWGRSVAHAIATRREEATRAKMLPGNATAVDG
jgi:peptidoglycan/LPS O-acetylase OafA/YrhL